MTQFCTMPPLVEVIEATKHLPIPTTWKDNLIEARYAEVIEIAEMKRFIEDKHHIGGRLPRTTIHSLHGSEVNCSWYGEYELYYVAGVDRKNNNLICNKITFFYNSEKARGKRGIVYEEIPLSLIREYKTLNKLV